MDTTNRAAPGEADERTDLPRILVRNSRDGDVPGMLAIYLHHIRRGVDPGVEENEFEPPDAEDLKRRRKSMNRRKMPHLVAEEAGTVVGYAYAVPFRKRPAYRYTIKHSIYVRSDRLHAGIGRRLMTALIDACAAAGFRQMIGYIDAANVASLKLHEGFGFRQGRASALGRLQIRPLDRYGDGAALARTRRDRAAGGVRRRTEKPSIDECRTAPYS
jgi:phosphinothricin acetyltransferase